MVKSFKNNSGFTLAEVLITLGIIGILAAMTIPTLLNTINDIQYKTAYKKAYSIISEVVKSVNNDSEFVDARTDSRPRPNDFDKNFLAIMDKFKVTKACTSSNNADCWDSGGEKYDAGGNWWPADNCYAFMDASGMAWSQFYSGSNIIYVDTNGFKKPNQWGKDRFVFCLVDYTYTNGKNPMTFQSGVPVRVVAHPDNSYGVHVSPNKCATENDYFGTSWLMNQ